MRSLLIFCFEVRSISTLFWKAGSILILKSLGEVLLDFDPLFFDALGFCHLGTKGQIFF